MTTPQDKTGLSKSDSQLLGAFCRKWEGRWAVISSGIHTNEGKASIWNYLIKAGYVSKMVGPCPWHSFNFNITSKGSQHLQEICEELNQ